ncbi:MAG: MBL fold metallo-hydrolase [Anaerolineae bacterium]|nr:MBL fold metallo-hydrolase [Anaerolineae bacterium]
MKLKQVSNHCYAVINEKNRLGDANSGLINLGGGVVIDTQFDLPHARQMIEKFSTVWMGMPKQVVNTHEDADHVLGNQLFAGAEIIAHRSVPGRMKEVADPAEIKLLLWAIRFALVRGILKYLHPGVLALGQQMAEDFDFDGIELTFPTTLFEDRHALNLDGTEVQLIHVGPGHQMGDTLIYIPDENVLFAGDVLFRACTPIGWTGTYAGWYKTLDLIVKLNPAVVVPGHGPITDVKGVKEMKAYLEYVRELAKTFFDAGYPSVEAAKKIDIGPYANWSAPARLWLNVERAYREFRGEAADAPWDRKKAFNIALKIAKAQGFPIEF